MELAPFKRSRTQNVPGNLFVDESCIDCDVCRWMCPNVYGRKGIKSAVITQPKTTSDKLQAYAAMVACPVGSIRTVVSDPLVKQVLSDVFPAEIDPIRIPGVMHLGFHSPLSYGATPYMIRRPGGNVMIDSPRFNSKLADNIESQGGLALIILTHKDDVADHLKWKARFPSAQRVIHRADVTRESSGCEVLLEGSGPWTPFTAGDVTIHHTPGHTAGSLCILYSPQSVNNINGIESPSSEAVLFTGDHVGYSVERGLLDGFKSYNHGNVLAQLQSIELLQEWDFLWLLPGHGRMIRFESLEEKNENILRAVEYFKRDDESFGMLNIGYR
eukprot:CAMPEP_0170061968 /NCGR_PEP_ID=MMETSP0019_2-20121128/3360_1 /TAXON_ID=98059 /ORGANISM="Dinobryon sp., Strain UTEXLB2267" /LENGTH=328 /DNA_ID=CAMNT_0010267977 /DNA_START=43 /DNA_END=1029 /DNA_ORIENTATION=-